MSAKRCLRAGFTLIELLVVIAIIAILIALLVPAVQKVREAAARTQSTNNLKQIGVGFHSYNDVQKNLPYNGWRNGVLNYGNPLVKDSGSCFYQILPFIEQDALYQRGNGTMSANPVNSHLVPVPIYLCPGRNRGNGVALSAEIGPFTDYAINARVNRDDGNGNVANTRVAIQHIRDGSMNTILVGHAFMDPRHYSSTVGNSWKESIWVGGFGGTRRSSLTDFRQDDSLFCGTTNCQGDRWGSAWTQGALFCFGDGHVQIISYSIDQISFERLLLPRDGLPVNLP